MKDSIVEYFSGHEGYKCGYCKSATTNYSHGMWGHAMTPAVYEELLNRGWRRSGSYLYKPTNNVTCCPMYTINCHANEFTLSRSQRKVLRRFNHYLLTGEMRTISKYEKSQDKMEEKLPEIGYREGVAADEISLEVDRTVLNENLASEQHHSPSQNPSPPESPELAAATAEPEDAPKRRKSESSTPRESTPSRSSQPSVPTPVVPRQKGVKARAIRIQRKKDKLIARGIDPATVFLPRKTQVAKTVEELTKELPGAKVKFEVKLLKTDTPEYSELIPLEHSLYRKYQMQIHEDTEKECTLGQYKRFLCDNPLNIASDDFTGAYHQHYYLDEKLVAVGVLDILPTCVSSVYFFYDPDLMPLSLGTYAALREIAFVRELSKTHPDLSNYYMGFYIHSCVKMRYKGSFSPSFLLCPETYAWRILDDSLRSKLTSQKYARLNEDPDFQPERNRIEKVLILHRRTAMPYPIYELKRGTEDQDEIQEYCNLVGEQIAPKLYLYRA